jgi:hypothetical protein
MTVVTDVNFKAAIALAAAQITIAWSDTILTEVAQPLKNPMAPLRNIEKLFNFDAATGVVTSNDGYIDECYAGKAPSVGSQFDKVAD